MQQFLNFFINHWFLWSLFAVILLLIISMELRTQVGGVFKVDSARMVNLINHEHAVVLDIRESDTFAEGHIIDAINIPMADLSAKRKKLNKFKNKPIIIVCNNGQQAIKVGVDLRKGGIEKVYALNGGIAAWRNANMPLTHNK